MRLNVEALRTVRPTMDILAALPWAAFRVPGPHHRVIEVEPSKRGTYGGAVGVGGVSTITGRAIAIRTAVIKKTLFVQKRWQA